MKSGSLNIYQNYNTFVNTSLAVVRPDNVTAYAANDIISTTTSSTYAANVLQNIWPNIYCGGYAVTAKLTTSQSACTARLRAHLVGVDDVLFNQDNAPFNAVSLSGESYFGYIEFPALALNGNASLEAHAQVTDSRMFLQPFDGSRNLYFVLQTLDAFTPDDSQIFNLGLLIDVQTYKTS